MKRYALGSFTARELKIIELRTSGMKPGEIALRLGVKRQRVYDSIARIYRKTGLSNTAQLTRWAWENATDEALGPERAEDLPIPEKKVRRTKPRINMRRLRSIKGPE